MGSRTASVRETMPDERTSGPIGSANGDSKTSGKTADDSMRHSLGHCTHHCFDDDARCQGRACGHGRRGLRIDETALARQDAHSSRDAIVERLTRFAEIHTQDIDGRNSICQWTVDEVSKLILALTEIYDRRGPIKRYLDFYWHRFHV